MQKIIRGRGSLLTVLLLMALNAGVVSANVDVVKDVNLESYAGTWYEIARIPNKLQKGMVDVTSTFKPLGKGDYSLITKGFKGSRRGKRTTIEGKVVVNRKKTGDLKVKVMRFFTVGYKIIDLDKKDYQFALVTSDSKDFLWILSKTPVMDERAYNKMVMSAREKGFDVGRLERVPQSLNSAVAER